MAARITNSRIDITGQRFGRLVVLYSTKLDSGRALKWICRCDCGIEKEIRGTSLRSGHAQSCGCLQLDTTLKHGDTIDGKRSPEYQSYYSLLDRCFNPHSKDYKRYGARGISVCNQWRFGMEQLTGFEVFLADMGRKPSSQHSIDRFPDMNGNYEPGNCRWATPTEQAVNRRSTVWIKVGNEMKPISHALAHIPNGREMWGQWMRRKKLSAQDAYERVIERAGRGARQGQN